MNSQPWFLSGLIALIGIGIGLAVREGWKAEDLNDALNASLRRQTNLLQEIGKLHHIESALPTASRTKAAVKRMPIALSDSPDNTIANKARLQGIRIIRSNADLVYRSYLIRLGLSSDQIERWETAMAEYHQRNLDLIESAAQQGLSLPNPGIAALRATQNNEWHAQEAQIVGQEAQTSIQNFTRTLPAANLLSEVAGSVATSSEPITAEQGSQLREMIADASKSYQQGQSVNPDTVDWEAVFAGARKVLSSGQLAAFQNVVSDFQIRSQLRQRVTGLTQKP